MVLLWREWNVLFEKKKMANKNLIFLNQNVNSVLLCKFKKKIHCI